MILQMIAAASGTGMAYLSYRKRRRGHQAAAPIHQAQAVVNVAPAHGRWRLWAARARVVAAVLPPDSIAGAGINIATAAVEMAVERRANGVRK